MSTDSQDLQRQERLIVEAQAAGHYVAGVYREKASGARTHRPELLRMIQDLQAGEIVIAEKIDRISRLPLEDAEKLVAAIRAKRAKLAVPGIVDLSEVSTEAEGVSKVVLDSVQDMLLKVSPQMAREDYEDRRARLQQGIDIARRQGKYRGRRPNKALHDRIVALREGGYSIAETARLAGCSGSQVKRVWANQQSEAIDGGAAMGSLS